MTELINQLEGFFNCCQRMYCRIYEHCFFEVAKKMFV